MSLSESHRETGSPSGGEKSARRTMADEKGGIVVTVKQERNLLSKDFMWVCKVFLEHKAALVASIAKNKRAAKTRPPCQVAVAFACTVNKSSTVTAATAMTWCAPSAKMGFNGLGCLCKSDRKVFLHMRAARFPLRLSFCCRWTWFPMEYMSLRSNAVIRPGCRTAKSAHAITTFSARLIVTSPLR